RRRRAGRCTWAPPPPAPATPPTGLRGEGTWVRVCRGALEIAMLEHISAANSVRSLSRLRGRVGEGVERTREPFCMPPPCPSPVNGGGDAGADGLSVAAPAA